MRYTLEVIGFNIESCIIAQSAGAHRIELCDNPADGGTTPSYGFIKMARKHLHISLYPIIRPRGGDFFYSDAEFEVMKADVQLCKDLGCDGVVTGMLQKDGSVDKLRCGILAAIAYPMGLTFHRAFDRVADHASALEDVIEADFERILTSGLHPTATEGTSVIASLIEQADERIIIMPGSGVRADNIIELLKNTGATEFHTSARIPISSRMEYFNPSMKEQLSSVTADEAEIRDIIQLLQSQSAL